MEFPASFFVHCSQVAGVSTAAKCSRSPAEKFASLHLQINLHRLRHRQVTLAQSPHGAKMPASNQCQGSTS